MFDGLPYRFKEFGLLVDVRSLLTFQKAVEKGLVSTLGDVYGTMKAIVVNDPQMLGPYTRAFYDYFLNIDIQNGERLDDAILRSVTFQNWKKDIIERDNSLDGLSDEELAQLFLDQVHMTNYDIKEVIDGKEIWDQDEGDLSDEDGVGDGSIPQKNLDKLADYSDLSLDELMERMREVWKNQRTEHSGGSHWIGTGGISPYGHGGGAIGGIRVGGTGGGRMARKVLGDKNFFPVDMDRIVNDDNVDAALASLKGIVEESAHEKLDVKSTINEGLRRGGLFIPEIEQEKEEKMRVLLFIDNGGYSMTPYIRTVKELFKKMKTRFAHDLETYYFHNTIYDRVFSDMRRSKVVWLDNILSKDPSYRVFIIGDASMAPYELNKLSLRTYKKISKKFKRTVWLNPEPKRYWPHTFTINIIKQAVDMYPLTPRGIEEAVGEMNKKR